MFYGYLCSSNKGNSLKTNILLLLESAFLDFYHSSGNESGLSFFEVKQKHETPITLLTLLLTPDYKFTCRMSKFMSNVLNLLYFDGKTH